MYDERRDGSPDDQPAALLPDAVAARLPDDRPLLSVKKLARRLNVPKRTARRLVKRREIRGIEIAGCIRIVPCDVDRFIETCARAAEAAGPPTMRQLAEESAREASLLPQRRVRLPRRAGRERRPRACRGSSRGRARAPGGSDDDGPAAPAGPARHLVGGWGA